MRQTNKIHLYARWKLFRRSVIKHKTLLLMILPTLLYFVIFRYGTIAGLLIAFVDFKSKVGETYLQSVMSSEFVGLKYFNEFLTSIVGKQVIINTILISTYKLIFGFPGPILLALLLNELINVKFKRVVQTITYLPHFISWVIMAGILRLLLSPDFGVFIPMFNFFKIPPVNYIGSARYFRGLLVVSDIIKEVGWGSIIYLAALSGLDPQLFEAAKIDGAGRLQQTLFITLPGIAPTITVMLILRMGFILDAGFDQVFNLKNASVISVGEIIDTYVYSRGIQNNNFSFATAVGFFKSAIGLALVLITNRVTRTMGQEGIV